MLQSGTLALLVRRLGSGLLRFRVVVRRSVISGGCNLSAFDLELLLMLLLHIVILLLIHILNNKLYRTQFLLMLLLST